MYMYSTVTYSYNCPSSYSCFHLVAYAHTFYIQVHYKIHQLKETVIILCNYNVNFQMETVFPSSTGFESMQLKRVRFVNCLDQSF